MGETFLLSFGYAKRCEATKTHSPTPLRYVWHHILPQTCGGKTVAANLIEVCDNCHYGIHAILHDMAVNGGRVSKKYRHLVGTGRYEVAKKGYQSALDTGTLNKIPNEGEE